MVRRLEAAQYFTMTFACDGNLVASLFKLHSELILYRVLEERNVSENVDVRLRCCNKMLPQSLSESVLFLTSTDSLIRRLIVGRLWQNHIFSCASLSPSDCDQ